MSSDNVESLHLRETAQGVLVPVRVQPGARRTGVLGIQAGRLRLAVAAPPQQGKANQAAARLLAKVAQVAPAQVELIRGASSRTKEFLLQGLSAQQLLTRLQNCLNQR